jgi:hypothetical protein
VRSEVIATPCPHTLPWLARPSCCLPPMSPPLRGAAPHTHDSVPHHARPPTVTLPFGPHRHCVCDRADKAVGRKRASCLPSPQGPPSTRRILPAAAPPLPHSPAPGAGLEVRDARVWVAHGSERFGVRRSFVTRSPEAGPLFSSSCDPPHPPCVSPRAPAPRPSSPSACDPAPRLPPTPAPPRTTNLPREGEGVAGACERGAGKAGRPGPCALKCRTKCREHVEQSRERTRAITVVVWGGGGLMRRRPPRQTAAKDDVPNRDCTAGEVLAGGEERGDGRALPPYPPSPLSLRGRPPKCRKS